MLRPSVCACGRDCQTELRAELRRLPVEHPALYTLLTGGRLEQVCDQYAKEEPAGGRVLILRPSSCTAGLAVRGSEPRTAGIGAPTRSYSVPGVFAVNTQTPGTEPGCVAAGDTANGSTSDAVSVKRWHDKPLPVGTRIYKDRRPCDLCGAPIAYTELQRSGKWRRYEADDMPHAARCSKLPTRPKLDPNTCARCGSSDVERSNPRPDVHPGGYLTCRGCRRGRWLPADRPVAE